ncbi:MULTISPECIES: mannitol dehydrogenase family protein [Halocynthiibacter]|uniref:Mannitol dehydrogenase family protein n=1 Tax=Halocynthiibacter halioticoli TaxID=2986804 RepID=A0AAE3J0B9_9RHOB|nr:MULTISPECIES: mannitol dehydrogenase family protein [Halocynthiibacter]MCV6825423.1 mannitol dehydrogenase family protein [Halocynthiibacter halioticoli]MCW4058424.1 mannitol dehydrogenase family protein [Halocynthiibacter sp. SDUM655004]
MSVPRLKRTGSKPNVGIVHLGPGAFFRAFNAVYTDDAIKQGDKDWGILAVSLRSPTAKDQLDPQDGAFTSVTLGAGQTEYRVINSISGVLVAPEDPEAVLSKMADPAVKIVSLTITEKGYCHEPATGELQLDHSDIAHDLANPEAPKSAIGFIVEALARRRAAAVAPFTVMPCDNIPSNGTLAKGMVLAFAKERESALAAWIEENCAFPSTMVDRITPATTPADVKSLEKAQGYHDPACVQHEPFRQWVIEDNFVNGERPQWEAGGAQFVADVDAHELMKLRCLNGTHSTLAYLGYLAGFETIAETVAEPAFAELCKRIWRDEIIPTVPKPEGEDLEAYCDALLERYQNPSIRHRTWQIAMDGSQKLPQRLLGTIADNIQAGREYTCLALAVAGWIRYVGGVDENGDRIEVKDPLADKLKAAIDGANTPAAKVQAVLSMKEVFDPSLSSNPDFVARVTEAYEGLLQNGALAVVKS